MPGGDYRKDIAFFGCPKNHKRCPMCEKTKHFKHFSKNWKKKNGIGEYCLKCIRVRARTVEATQAVISKRKYYYETSRWVELLKQYGITKEQYESKWTAQNGLCAVCGKPETFQWKGTVRRLCVDHDHKTGNVRSLLCTACNKGLGCFNDDAGLMHRAAEYLLSHQTE